MRNPLLKLFFLCPVLVFCLLLFSLSLFSSENAVDLWGVSFKKDTVSMAYSEKIKDEEKESRILDYFLCALVCGSNELYVNLGAGWLGKDIPFSILLSKMGKDLVAMDLLLKEKVRQILSDFLNRKIYNYWRDVILLDKKLPNEIYVEVMPVYARLFLLKDGVMLPSITIKVLVSSGESSELVDILEQELSNIVTNSPDFEPLRQMIRASLLAIECKHQVISGDLDFSLKAVISKDRILGVLTDETQTLRLIDDYLRLFSKPLIIRMLGKKIEIKGAIDLTGRGIETDVRRIDVDLNEAINIMGEGWIAPPVRLSWKEYKSNLKSVFSSRYVSKKKNGIFDRSRNIWMLDFVDAEFLGLPPGAAKTGVSWRLKGKRFVEELKQLCLLVGWGWSWLDGAERYEFYISYIAKKKLTSLEHLYISQVAIGRLAFVRSFWNGLEVAVELDDVNKEFYSVLLEKLDKRVLMWIRPSERDRFWNILKAVWNESVGVLRIVKLLSTVQQFSYALDKRILRPWFLIRGEIMDRDGWDVDVLSGIVWERMENN